MKWGKRIQEDNHWLQQLAETYPNNSMRGLQNEAATVLLLEYNIIQSRRQQ